MILYFIHLPFLGTYTFGGDANGYAYFGFLLTLFGMVTYLLTYGVLLAKTGWVFVISIVIPVVGLINQIILTALIIDSRNND
jgi:ATP/ADP translocase